MTLECRLSCFVWLAFLLFLATDSALGQNPDLEYCIEPGTPTLPSFANFPLPTNHYIFTIDVVDDMQWEGP